MKTSELTGVKLDFWVAMSGDAPFYRMQCDWPGNHRVNTEQFEHPIIVENLIGELWIEHAGKVERFAPSTNWAQGGPIIEREGIQLSVANYFSDPGGSGFTWFAETWTNPPARGSANDEPLVAAMRAFISSKFGAEVPDDNAPAQPAAEP